MTFLYLLQPFCDAINVDHPWHRAVVKTKQTLKWYANVYWLLSHMCSRAVSIELAPFPGKRFKIWAKLALVFRPCRHIPACLDVACSVWLFVGYTVNPAKVAEPIEMPFGMLTHAGSGNHEFSILYNRGQLWENDVGIIQYTSKQSGC